MTRRAQRNNEFPHPAQERTRALFKHILQPSLPLPGEEEEDGSHARQAMAQVCSRSNASVGIRHCKVTTFVSASDISICMDDVELTGRLQVVA